MIGFDPVYEPQPRTTLSWKITESDIETYQHTKKLLRKVINFRKENQKHLVTETKEHYDVKTNIFGIKKKVYSHTTSREYFDIEIPKEILLTRELLSKMDILIQLVSGDISAYDFSELDFVLKNIEHSQTVHLPLSEFNRHKSTLDKIKYYLEASKDIDTINGLMSIEPFKDEEIFSF